LSTGSAQVKKWTTSRRNHWTTSSGIGGQLRPESVDNLPRNTHPLCAGSPVLDCAMASWVDSVHSIGYPLHGSVHWNRRGGMVWRLGRGNYWLASRLLGASGNRHSPWHHLVACVSPQVESCPWRAITFQAPLRSFPVSLLCCSPHCLHSFQCHALDIVWLAPDVCFHEVWSSLANSVLAATAYLQAGSVTGVLTWGLAADLISRKVGSGRLYLIAMNICFCTPCAMLILNADSLEGLKFATLGFGFFAGSLSANVTAAAFDVVSKRNYGFVVGIINLAAGVGGGASMFLVGLTNRPTGMVEVLKWTGVTALGLDSGRTRSCIREKLSNRSKAHAIWRRGMNCG